MAILDQLAGVVQVVEAETYQSFEYLARERIARRHEDDWPILAAAHNPPDPWSRSPRPLANTSERE